MGLSVGREEKNLLRLVEHIVACTMAAQLTRHCLKTVETCCISSRVWVLREVTVRVMLLRISLRLSKSGSWTSGGLCSEFCKTHSSMFRT